MDKGILFELYQFCGNRVFVCDRYCKSRLVSVWLSYLDFIDIGRFYEEQVQPSCRSAWPACPNAQNTVNRAPIGGIDTICAAVFHNRCDS